MFWFWNDKDKMQKWKDNNVYNTESMLPLSEIRGDTIILKDGWLRAIIKIDGLNIDLKNYEEQEMVVEQYKKFLNGLDFPIQILVRNNYLELSDYIDYMHEHVSGIAQSALKEQGEAHVSFLENINAKQWLIYVKEFYIIVPYYPLEDDAEHMRRPRWKKFMDALTKVDTPEKIVQRYRSFLKHDKFLDTRANVIMESLRSMGIQWERLGLSDIVALIFKHYNPDIHQNQATFSW